MPSKIFLSAASSRVQIFTKRQNLLTPPTRGTTFRYFHQAARIPPVCCIKTSSTLNVRHRSSTPIIGIRSNFQNTASYSIASHKRLGDIYTQFKEKNLVVHGTEEFKIKDSKFQAHVLRNVKSKGEVISFLSILFSDKKISKANTNMTAYRIPEKQEAAAEDSSSVAASPGDGSSPPGKKLRSFKNDDGERGAGDILLHLLEQREEENTCVVVTRWVGRTPLGPQRFRVIKQMGSQALDLKEDA